MKSNSIAYGPLLAKVINDFFIFFFLFLFWLNSNVNPCYSMKVAYWALFGTWYLQIMQENKLSAVCERVLDKCLAPSTAGGEGCDNMTMILVQLKKTTRPTSSVDKQQSSPSKAAENESKPAGGIWIKLEFCWYLVRSDLVNWILWLNQFSTTSPISIHIYIWASLSSVIVDGAAWKCLISY